MKNHECWNETDSKNKQPANRKRARLGAMLALITISSVPIIGCKKELSYEKERSPIVSNVSKFKDILRFDSPETFKSTLKELNENDDMYDHQFFSELGVDVDYENMRNLSIEEQDEISDHLHKLEEEYDYENEKVFKDFESKYEFSSLRSVTSRSDIKSSDSNFLLDLADLTNLATLLNPYHEVMVGDTIIKFFEDGSVFGIVNFDYELIQGLRDNGYTSYIGHQNLIVRNYQLEKKHCDIRNNKTSYETVNVSPNRRLILKTAYYHLWWFNIIHGKITHERYIAGRWRKRRAGIAVVSQGHSWQYGFCIYLRGHQGTVSAGNRRTRRSNVFFDNAWTDGETGGNGGIWIPGTKTHYTTSNHSGPGLNNYLHRLTFNP